MGRQVLGRRQLEFQVYSKYIPDGRAVRASDGKLPI